MEDYIIKNISIDREEYNINDYISLRRNGEYTNIYIMESNEYEASPYLFFHAIKIAVPKVNLNLSYREKLSSETEFKYYLYKNDLTNYNKILINYYAKPNDSPIEGYEMITSQDIERLKEVFNIVIEYNKRTAEKQKQEKWLFNRFDIAYNNYLNANSAISIEDSIMNLITVLESLLVDGIGELSFRVALNTSLIVENTIDKRQEVFKLIKYMYKIRSKAVHGELFSAAKKLRDLDYNEYFKFKEIVARVLIKTFNKDEKDIFKALELMLYSSNEFDNYLNWTS